MNVNRYYRDRLFKFLFGNRRWKENSLSLYNALNKTAYTDASDLEITTLEDVIYMGMKNDVSFIVDGNLSIIEHQSTYNLNMPVRGLLYYARLVDKYIQKNNMDIFGTTRLMLPRPRYVILYNGKKQIENRSRMKLSDSYMSEGKFDVEVTATMIDINIDSSDEVLARCPI